MTDFARLTPLSSRTLTLVLERQRLATLSPGGTLPSSSLTQITKNLQQLRTGIVDAEAAGEDTSNIRQQWVRMRTMLGDEVSGVESLPPAPSTSIHFPPQPKSPLLTTYSGGDPIDTPYSDDPDPEASLNPHEMIGMQQQMMEDQDSHLDLLSQSINRQRDISIHIGSELEVHEGLLTELDGSVDRTTGRLSSARKRLDKVARGTKENASAVTIGALIFILLILIVVFKT